MRSSDRASWQTELKLVFIWPLTPTGFTLHPPEMDMRKSFSPALPTTLRSSQMQALAVPLYMLTLCGLPAFPTLFLCRLSVPFPSSGILPPSCVPNAQARQQHCLAAGSVQVKMEQGHRSSGWVTSCHRPFWRRKIEVALTYNWISAFGLSLRLLEPTIKWSLKSHVVCISEHKTPASSM